MGNPDGESGSTVTGNLSRICQRADLQGAVGGFFLCDADAFVAFAVVAGGNCAADLLQFRIFDISQVNSVAVGAVTRHDAAAEGIDCDVFHLIGVDAVPDIGDAAGEIGDGALAEQNKAGTVVLAGNTGDVSSDVDPGGGIGAEPAESDGTGNAGAGGESSRRSVYWKLSRRRRLLQG